MLEEPAVLPETPALINPATGVLITDAEVADGMASAELAAGTLGLEAAIIPTLAIVAVGVTTYGAIKFGNGLGGFLYRKFHSDDPATASGTLSFTWNCYGGTPTEHGCNTSLSIGTFLFGNIANTQANPAYVLQDNASGMAYCVGGTGCNWPISGDHNTYMQNMVGHQFVLPNSQCGGSYAGGVCALKYRTADEMLAHVTASPATAADYAAAGNKIDNSLFDPTKVTPNTEGALNAVGATTSEPLTANQYGALFAMNRAVDPTWNPGDEGTTPLPQPDPKETYGQYTKRLRDLGYLGSIVLLDDTDYDPFASLDYGAQGYAAVEPLAAPFPPGTCDGGACVPAVVATPTTLTRIKVGSAISTDPWRVYLPDGQFQPWPDTPPRIDLKKTPRITLYKVPDTYVPPINPDPNGTADGPPGGGDSGGKCNPPPIHSVDFVPLESLDLGNKFPFGIFGMLSTVVGYFNVSPVTPEVNIDFHGIATDTIGSFVSVTGDWSYDVKLDHFDSYMSEIRTILSFVLWVGAVWYIGAALLGFRAGGDISEATDEAFVD
jgi:hypothetical protein